MGLSKPKMQTLVQVVSSGGKSLRDLIVNDTKLEDFGLRITKKQQPGRAHGWAKIHSSESEGALNIEWDAAARILTCRVVNRGRGRPNRIVSELVDYLMARRSSRIQAINIYRR